jgi:hypothetical protein
MSDFRLRVFVHLDRGTHYTWPASALPYQLEMAMRKVLVKKEAEKAAKQARMAGSAGA